MGTTERKEKAKAKDDQSSAWSADDLVCISTYRILEGDNFLDQFEDADISFDDAPEIAMKDLRFFPGVTDNTAGLALLARQMARRFLAFLVKVYGAKKHIGTTSDALIEGFAAIFSDPDATIAALAQTVRKRIKFPSTKAEVVK